jgi:PAT family beta-lactamase induction signal transducer AmpG
MSSKPPSVLRLLLWIPSLYFAMGIPYNVINSTAVRMYKSLGFPDSQITVAVGSIGIAWSLKPLWAAFLDMYRTKKFFVISMEVLCGLLFAAIAMSLTAPGFFQISIALFWVAAFASSTQDICADGLYLSSVDKTNQSRFAGLQGTFWVLGKVLASGLLISVLFALKDAYSWSDQVMWRNVMLTCATTMGILALYNFFALPPGEITKRPTSLNEVASNFLSSAITFFHKREFWGMIAFVFLYRLGEGLILMVGQLFMQGSTAQGGLGLTAGQVSDIDSIYGTAAGIMGGLLGGVFIGKMRLSRSLWFLGLCLNVPHFTFVFLSHYAAAGHSLDYSTIVTMVSIEKFGYGFGMVGNMIYMMQQLAPGRCTMTHYAFATALMNLVIVPTAMISGPLADWLGFSTFFVVVMFASVPSVLVAWRAPFPQKEDDQVTDDKAPNAMITLDDPSRLNAVETKVQQISGRASIYAMANIFIILLVNTQIIGTLQGHAPGTGKPQFLGLLILMVVQVFFARRTLANAKEAIAIAGPTGEKHYSRNARGAKIATYLCLGVSLATLGFAAKMAF